MAHKETYQVVLESDIFWVFLADKLLQFGELSVFALDLTVPENLILCIIVSLTIVLLTSKQPKSSQFLPLHLH